MDLEPEGKIYICISLTGSFIDGKAANMLISLSNKYLGDKRNKDFDLCHLKHHTLFGCQPIDVHACVGVTRAGQYVPGMLVCSLQTSVDINVGGVCVCA